MKKNRDKIVDRDPAWYDIFAISPTPISKHTQKTQSGLEIMNMTSNNVGSRLNHPTK